MADAMGAHLCPETSSSFASPQPSLHQACADTCASCLRAICPYKMLWEQSPCTPLPNPALCKGKTQVWVKLYRCKTLTFGVHHVDRQTHPALLPGCLWRNRLCPACTCPEHLGRVCCPHPVHAPLLKRQQPLSRHSAAKLPQPIPCCSAWLRSTKRV